MQDLYEILGVSQDASEEEIKRAYRQRARTLHPDAGGDDEAFKELTTAYEVLRNPETRANYDRYGDPRGPSGGGGADFGGFGDLSDLIEAFFGGFGGRSRGGTPRGENRHGRDAIVELEVTLEEAAAGVRRDLDVTVPRACGECGGSGAAAGSQPVRCEGCGGAGAVQRVGRSAFGQMLTTTVCPRCRGSGEQLSDPCGQCRGQGRVETTEQVTVDVPPGVDEGTRLRISGQGEAGRRGGRAGDLYVRVHVSPHEIFTRDGDDLRCELALPVTQAALGAELKVPTLYGEEVLKIPAGAQTGEVITLRRQGMPRLGGGGHQRGDLHVHSRVMTPTELDAEQEQLLRQLAELRGESVAEEGRGLFSRLRDALRL